MMNHLVYQDRTYYLNSAKPTDAAYQAFTKRRQPIEEQEYFLATRHHAHFHPRHLSGFDDLSWIAGFFEDIKQPTENHVQRAMVLTLTEGSKEDQFHWYSLKAGGGSVSDHIFSSSFSILIADPSTGEDKKVVLLKKYSTQFENVLITFNELAALFEACSSPAQRRERDTTHAKDVLALLVRASLQGTLPFATKKVKATPFVLQEFYQKLASEVDSESLAAAIHQLEETYRKEQARLIEEIPGNVTQASYHQEWETKIQALHRLVRGTMVQPCGTLDLFAA